MKRGLGERIFPTAKRRGTSVAWRVQNRDGVGPMRPHLPKHCGIEAPEGSAYVSRLATRAMLQTGVLFEADPLVDFDTREWNQRKRGMMFGFESPAHAERFFGKDALEAMSAFGFYVMPVPASVVYRSRSGLQVAFVPHRSAVEGTPAFRCLYGSGRRRR